MINSFRELAVWQKGMHLVVRVYASTARLPRDETFGLTAQMRRAAVSIPANIAEGKAIGGRSYLRHLRIALGSESELETHIELTRRLSLLQESEAQELLTDTSEVGRMLAELLRSLSRD
jgi:four helix bundle protein